MALKCNCNCCPEVFLYGDSNASPTCATCGQFFCAPCLKEFSNTCFWCAYVSATDRERKWLGSEAKDHCLRRTVDFAEKIIKAAAAQAKALNYELKPNKVDPEDSQSSTKVDAHQTVVKMKATTLNKPTIASGANVSIGGIKTIFTSQ